MKLEMRLIKEFEDESNMRASRDAIKVKAEQAGYIFLWTVSE
ncbi:unnamed protein product [marine sediment metagenome]|uniref:Uncharacterized protein n=1 Tax=marine sediment metagenome TaxID=412755 RepID=X1TSS1_9ZZZZ